MIPVQLSDISGVDLVEANVRFAMGDFSQDPSFDGNDVPISTFVLHADRPGVFAGVRLSSELEERVYRRVMYVEEGEEISAFDGANKALGILFLRFGNVGELERLTGSIGEGVEVLYS